jgi:hypothetical protein
MGKTRHEWQRLAIRSRDGEGEIALPLSFRMRGLHVALPRSRRHDTRRFHLPYLCRPSSPASQNKYHLTHFCVQEGGNIFVWKVRAHLRNCQTARVHIMYLHRLGEPPGSGVCARFWTAVLASPKLLPYYSLGNTEKNIKSVFPSKLERRNIGIEVLSVNTTPTNINNGRNKRRRRSELGVNSVSLLCESTFHPSE